MPDLRASDADREHCVAALRHHGEAGRLTVDELEERIGHAYAAKTLRELADLQADLPALTPRPAPPPPASRHGPRVPGAMGFSAAWHAPTGPEVTMAELATHVAPKLQAYGYRLVERDRLGMRFAWSYRPAWTILPAILLFPFGLIALLHKRHDEIVIDLVEAPDGTRVVASGVAPLAVRRAFAQLED